MKEEMIQDGPLDKNQLLLKKVTEQLKQDGVESEIHHIVNHRSLFDQTGKEIGWQSKVYLKSGEHMNVKGLNTNK